MPGDARGVGRRVGGGSGALPRPPRFRPQRPRASPSSSGQAASRKRAAGHGGVTRVPGSAPRGSSSGLGSPTGHPKPASPTRSGRELSPRLLPPLRHQERLSSPRCPQTLSPPASRGVCMSQFCIGLCNGSPRGGCPENLGLRVESNQHGSEVPGSGTYGCGMGDIASPLEALERALTISPAPLLPSA